ncbi:hypothetical protein [Nocardioides alcanivorans]|uniref:hypothetical protein n=1 Tax=Nocardioides alcanivorans TaxID=2897352 RepID=UPI001F451BB4|nr:hypothetical protein [Nocardioides alcanivorans]
MTPRRRRLTWPSARGAARTAASTPSRPRSTAIDSEPDDSDDSGVGPAALLALARDDADKERFAATLAAALPWVAHLPAHDQDAFCVEAAATLRECAATARFGEFAELLDDWRAAADIWTDPALPASLKKSPAPPEE